MLEIEIDTYLKVVAKQLQRIDDILRDFEDVIISNSELLEIGSNANLQNMDLGRQILADLFSLTKAELHEDRKVRLDEMNLPKLEVVRSGLVPKSGESGFQRDKLHTTLF